MYEIIKRDKTGLVTILLYKDDVSLIPKEFNIYSKAYFYNSLGVKKTYILVANPDDVSDLQWVEHVSGTTFWK